MFWTEFIYFWELLEAFGKMAGDFEFEFKHYNWNYDTAYLYFQVATRNLTLVCSYVCLAKSRMRSKAVVVGRRYNFIPHLPKKGGITNLSTKTNCGRFDKVLFSWYIVCTLGDSGFFRLQGTYQGIVKTTHTDFLSIWMTKRQAISTDAFQSC